MQTPRLQIIILQPWHPIWVLWKDALGDKFVMADIPGLVEGASEGVGLGHEFLRHVERTKVFIHVVDAAGVEGDDPVENVEKINRELAEYKEDLLKRPQVIAANKTDIPGSEENVARLKEAYEPQGFKVFPILRQRIRGWMSF